MRIRKNFMYTTLLIMFVPALLWAAPKELVVVPADEAQLSNVSTLERANAVVQEYTIGPHDLLEVEVFRVEEFTRVVRVNSRGSISLPLLGSIEAAGKSSEELENIIALKLQDNFLQEPHVSVFIKEYASQKVTLEGEVQKPGLYALSGRTTVLQAIAMAEGLTDLASVSDIQLFRPGTSGKITSYTLDVEAIRNGEAHDPLVFGNDILVIHKAGARAFVKAFTDTLRGFITFGIPLNSF